MIKNLHLYNSAEELAENIAIELMALIGRHPAETFHLGISGGKTPELLFNILAEKFAETSFWQHVHFWWVDERMVPVDDPESNYGVANRLLFSRINIPQQNIHRIKGENHPETEALSYSNQIQETLPIQKGWPVFNLILLGMGEDGHTASIFPNQMHLFQSNQICEVSVHPQTRQNRITMTGRAINAAQLIWFVVTGPNKSERLKEISLNSGNAENLPAAHIKPVNGELVWYADKAATKNIPENPLQ